MGLKASVADIQNGTPVQRRQKWSRLDVEEDVKRSLSDLWCAVSGDQRTLGILAAKMEDAVRDFSRLWLGCMPAADQLG